MLVTTAATRPLDEMIKFMVPNPKGQPVLVRGAGAVVEDEDGGQYVDLEGGPGVTSVGHCHPHVVTAVCNQAGTLMQSSGRYHSRLALGLAERISDLTDGHLSRAFFSNSGAEANDGAAKLALKHAVATGKRGFAMLALEHGYHGRTSLPLALTGISEMKVGFGPYCAAPNVVHLPLPYFYRCPFGSANEADCGDRAAQALRQALKSRVYGDAAFMIAEPILGLSGVIIPPANYWPQVEEICAENNITLIMDEVYSGFGRTGKIFAHQHWNLKPSIMTFAKAIGGGLPLGGYIATSEVAMSLEPNDHNTTFGANNQVGLAAAHAVLDVLELEDLTRRSAAAGEILLEKYLRLQSQHHIIGDVRGRGLMLGLEIVADRTSKEPAPELARRVRATLLDMGVMVGLSGVNHNVLRISPPLNIGLDVLEESTSAFSRAFSAVS